MGPRSSDRGNKEAAAVAVRAEVLQWGRDHLIAEISTQRPYKAAHELLQWGRDHLIAEMFTSGILTAPGAGGFNGAAII